MGKYKFKLRDDLPRGFKQNEEYPELPAILGYLKLFVGKTFSSTQQFQEQVLSKFLDYLKLNKISNGRDLLLRTGLALEKCETRYIGPSGIFDYFVFTKADNGSGKCVFGGLELLMQ